MMFALWVSLKTSLPLTSDQIGAEINHPGVQGSQDRLMKKSLLESTARRIDQTPHPAPVIELPRTLRIQHRPRQQERSHPGYRRFKEFYSGNATETDSRAGQELTHDDRYARPSLMSVSRSLCASQCSRAGHRRK